MSTQAPTPLPRPRRVGEDAGDPGPGAVLRYELSRRDRLYLARRRLLDAGCAASVRGPVPGSRTLLVLQVDGLRTQDDCDRVARIVRGTDPDCRRV